MKIDNVSISAVLWGKNPALVTSDPKNIGSTSLSSTETSATASNNRQELVKKLAGKDFHKITNNEIVDIANFLHDKRLISTDVHLNIGLQFSPIRLLNGDPSMNLNSDLSEQAGPIDAIHVFQKKIEKYNSGAPEMAAVNSSVRNLDAETFNVLSQLQDWINTGKGGGPIDDMA